MKPANTSTTTARAPRKALVNLIIRVLRPLARLMLRHGVTLYEFIAIARWVFAHVAMDHKRFFLGHRDAWAMTKSRCAVLTGMTRRQVDRQLSLDFPETEAARRNYHRGVRILEAWAAGPEYLDAHGVRRELPLRGAGSFDQLVRQHCRDTSMRSMLDELLSRGCVFQPTPHTVRFVHDYLDATPSFCCDISQLEQTAEDFMLLLERRLDNQPDSKLVHLVSPPLTCEERHRLQARLRLHMQAFVDEVRQEFSAASRTLHEARAERFVAGIYVGPL